LGVEGSHSDNTASTERKEKKRKGAGLSASFDILFCAEIMLKLGAGTFFLPPTPNLSNLLIEASIYCCLYAPNEELKGYPILLSDSRNT
jgi:hypothetical protein